MADIYSSFLAATPTMRVVELNAYSRQHELESPILGAIMFDGATGSCADRVSEGILQLAQRFDLLPAGGMVVEAGYGTFAQALALSARRLGHPLTLVIPKTVDIQRQQLLIGLGATLVTTDPLYGRDGLQRRAKEIAAETCGYFVNQFNNELNCAYHHEVTAPALMKALDGEIDIAVIGVGSAGTLTGVGEYLKAWAGNVEVVAVEPYECSVLSGGFAGRHNIPGLGAGFIPENYNPYIVDRIVCVPSIEAQRTAGQLLLCEGLPAGAASGAVVCAARQIAAQPENAGKRVVALLPTRQEI